MSISSCYSSFPNTNRVDANAHLIHEDRPLHALPAHVQSSFSYLYITLLNLQFLVTYIAVTGYKLCDWGAKILQNINLNVH